MAGARNPDPAPSDVSLILQAQKGDSRAIDELCAKYRGPVYSWAHLFTAGHFAADDITQEVLMLLTTKIGSVADPARLGGWLYRVTRRETLKYWRSTARRPETPVEDAPPAAPDLDDRILGDELAKALYRKV